MTDDELNLVTCFGCGRFIYQEYDEIDETGFYRWVDEERGYDSCTPGPNDEDRWHEPRPDFTTLEGVLVFLDAA